MFLATTGSRVNEMTMSTEAVVIYSVPPTLHLHLLYVSNNNAYPNAHEGEYHTKAWLRYW